MVAAKTAAVDGQREQSPENTRPFVSIVIPLFNEASIFEKNLSLICRYMESLESRYRWEIILVDDGSTDDTGGLADAFVKTRDNVFVLHHITNFRLGQALRSAFNHCRGDYVITLDVDLSYAPEHIERMLGCISETKAKIVIASPYMKEGRVTNVPWLRKTLSVWANRYLSLTAPGDLSTLTCMVRAYDSRFLRTLDLKAMESDINEEIIFKSQLLGARIVEIPAHLDWSLQKQAGAGRQSSMKIMKKIGSTLFSGFIFRPFMIFVLPGIMMFLISLYPIGWALFHTIDRYLWYASQYPQVSFGSLFSGAVRDAFILSPHSFLVGGFALLFSFQLISLGILALQSKRYFEEIFHLGTSIYKHSKEKDTKYQ
jgi:glycosyltransferase involved in cell wall biosynthesis